MVDMLYFTPGGARLPGPPPEGVEYISRPAGQPNALVGAASPTMDPRYLEGQQRRNEWSIRNSNWYGRDLADRLGTTDAELQQAYNMLSDADKVRSGYLGGMWTLQQAGLRDFPASGGGFPNLPAPAPGGGGGGYVPPPPPPSGGGGTPPPPSGGGGSPFDPGYDPLPPPPPVMPPEQPPVAPTAPPPSWVGVTPPPPGGSLPGGSPPPTYAPPPTGGSLPGGSPPPTYTPPPTGGSLPGGSPPPAYTPPGGSMVGPGPGPYPPVLGGQPTWGNPTDPHLLPFTPGSLLPPGQGGQPPSWWNEILQPSPLAPPGFPTAFNNPFFGNTGGFNVGSPYFAPMSTWGFYGMPHMAQYMPGGFGMVTPGMGGWYTGAPVGFNPTPGITDNPTPFDTLGDFTSALSDFNNLIGANSFNALASPYSGPYNYMQQGGAPRSTAGPAPSMYVSGPMNRTQWT